jgi:hypothetical protein
MTQLTDNMSWIAAARARGVELPAVTGGASSSREGLVSVVMPAHNEGRVIGRGLRAIVQAERPDLPLEVIVVANGCTDDTAAVARSFGGCVRVIETDVASKTNALNLGDRAASGFPRVYVDGDVILPAESLWRIVEHLRDGRALATGPRPRWDLSGASAAVRAYYDIDGQLPSSQVGIGGSGVYALSMEGRRRFGEFPQIIGDDQFVRSLFAPAERRPAEAAYSIVTPPKRLAGVVAIKTRGQHGNYQVRSRTRAEGNDAGNSAGNGERGGAANWPVLLSLVPHPGRWMGLAVYGYVKGLAKVRAYWRHRTGRAVRWERDETSRAVRPVSATVVPTPCAPAIPSPSTSNA